MIVLFCFAKKEPKKGARRQILQIVADVFQSIMIYDKHLT